MTGLALDVRVRYGTYYTVPPADMITYGTNRASTRLVISLRSVQLVLSRWAAARHARTPLGSSMVTTGVIIGTRPNTPEAQGAQGPCDIILRAAELLISRPGQRPGSSGAALKVPLREHGRRIA